MFKSGFLAFCVIFTLGFFAVQGFMLIKPQLPEEWFAKPEVGTLMVVPTQAVVASTTVPDLPPITFGKIENPQRIYQPLVADEYNGTLSEQPQKLTCHNGKAKFETGTWTIVYVYSQSAAPIINSPLNGGTVKIKCDPTSDSVMYIFAKHP